MEVNKRFNMEIQLEKFGKIGSANINLNGLSVIVGKNDSGKSTVGKCIYALKKSLMLYPTTYEQIHKLLAFALFSNIWPTMSSYITDSKIKDDINEERDSILKDVYDPSKDFETIYNKLNDIIEKNINSVEEKIEKDSNSQASLILKDNIKNFHSLKSVLEELAKLEFSMNGITLDKSTFQEMFCGNLNNSIHLEDTSVVRLLSTKDRIVVSLSIKKNSIKINKETDVSSFNDGFTDVVFIDTPLILENKTINFDETFYHKDLRNKLFDDNSKLYNNSQIIELFDSVIKGEFIKNSDSKNYSYKVSKESLELNLKNIAMGTKVLGLLYLLLKNGQININTLVILDEPENHLHPSWLIKLAEILCLMVSKGFRVLLTTHNPDFVKALSYYSDKYELSNNKSSHFYLCNEPEDNYTKIEEKTERMNEIYKNLTSDISEIFFKSVQESLKNMKPTNDE